MAAERFNSVCCSVAIVTCIAVGPTIGIAFARDPAPLTKDQAAFIWTLLERNARNSADAGFLLYTLYREPGDLLNQGWDRFGRGEQWLDWWLVVRPNPRRPLSGSDYVSFIECCDESETKAVVEKPKILERIVRAQLYLQGLDESGLRPRKEPIPFNEIKEGWLDWKELAYVENQRNGETDYALGFYDSDARRVRYWCRYVNNLRQCYWLFGRGDEVKSVTNFTWKRDYLGFRKWIVENESYLRFEKKDCRFVLDQDAKRTRRPVPADARLIPSPTSPFPDWKGSPPTVYDYELAR